MMNQFEYTPSLIEEFLNLIGDENPIHIDENLSNSILKKLGKTKEGIIVPGMYSFSVLASGRIPDNHNYIKVSFKEPVTQKDKVFYNGAYTNSFGNVIMEIVSKENTINECSIQDKLYYPFNISEEKITAFRDITNTFNLSLNKVIRSYIFGIVSGALWKYSKTNEINGDCLYLSQIINFNNTNFTNLLNANMQVFISKKSLRDNPCHLETILAKKDNIILTGQATCRII